MLEKDAKLVMASFTSAMPYIVYPGELRELIEKELADCDCMETFVENVRKKFSEKYDITRKTDGQIFLNELRRQTQI